MKLLQQYIVKMFYIISQSGILSFRIRCLNALHKNSKCYPFDFAFSRLDHLLMLRASADFYRKTGNCEDDSRWMNERAFHHRHCRRLNGPKENFGRLTDRY